MGLNGNVIGILAQDQHEDIELRYPLFRLREAGGRSELSLCSSSTSSSRLPVRFPPTRQETPSVPSDCDASVTEACASDPTLTTSNEKCCSVTEACASDVRCATGGPRSGPTQEASTRG